MTASLLRTTRPSLSLRAPMGCEGVPPKRDNAAGETLCMMQTQDLGQPMRPEWRISQKGMGGAERYYVCREETSPGDVEDSHVAEKKCVPGRVLQQRHTGAAVLSQHRKHGAGTALTAHREERLWKVQETGDDNRLTRLLLLTPSEMGGGWDFFERCVGGASRVRPMALQKCSAVQPEGAAVAGKCEREGRAGGCHKSGDGGWPTADGTQRSGQHADGRRPRKKLCLPSCDSTGNLFFQIDFSPTLPPADWCTEELCETARCSHREGSPRSRALLVGTKRLASW